MLFYLHIIINLSLHLTISQKGQKTDQRWRNAYFDCSELFRSISFVFSTGLSHILFANYLLLLFWRFIPSSQRSSLANNCDEEVPGVIIVSSQSLYGSSGGDDVNTTSTLAPRAPCDATPASPQGQCDTDGGLQSVQSRQWRQLIVDWSRRPRQLGVVFQVVFQIDWLL